MDDDGPFEPTKRVDRDGAHAASQIIFYAGRHTIMQKSNFLQIGKSVKFHDLFMGMCRANPTKMKVMLHSAEEVCTEAAMENTSVKKRSRMNEDEQRQKQAG